jgi:hypothetical protein
MPEYRYNNINIDKQAAAIEFQQHNRQGGSSMATGASGTSKQLVDRWRGGTTDGL